MPLDGLLVTARQRSCGKVVFSQVSVCPQGVGISVPMAFLTVGISGPMSLLGGGEYVRGWTPPTPDMGYNGIQSASRQYVS